MFLLQQPKKRETNNTAIKSSKFINGSPHLTHMCVYTHCFESLMEEAYLQQVHFVVKYTSRYQIQTKYFVNLFTQLIHLGNKNHAKRYNYKNITPTRGSAQIHTIILLQSLHVLLYLDFLQVTDNNIMLMRQLYIYYLTAMSSTLA